MSCEICGRSSCTRSFHSLEAQELFDEMNGKDRDDLINDVVELRAKLAAAREKLELSEERYIANRDLLNGIENWCEVVFMPPSGAIITINDWDDLKNHIAAMEESK